MGKLLDDSGSYTARDIKKNIRLVCWIFVWTVTMVLADKAELYQWYSSELLSFLAIIINAGIGIGLIFTFMRYLREIDELQRKIQLEALAMAMGVGLVGSFSYSLLVTAKFIMEEEVTDIILLTSVTYMIGIIVGQVRYR